MKAAYTGWTWLINHGDNHKWEFEQFLKEVSDLGYQAVENFAFIKGYFDDDANAVVELLKKYKLEMANLYLHLSDDGANDIEKAKEYIEFMKQIGATYMNLQAIMWNEAPNDRPTDEGIVKDYARRADEIGRLCTESGLKACFHSHANTHVFRENEIDLLLASSSPDNLHLCLDTAHIYLAGMNVVDAFKKYGNRTAYVHFKDVNPDESIHPEWPMKRFLPLGEGGVDFKGVYNALLGCGYDGVICVELDNPAVCNYKAAMTSAHYLRDVLGLI